MFTLKQLHEKTKLIDWLNLIIRPIQQKLGSIPLLNLTESSTILVSDVNYTLKTVEILAKTPPRTIANYIGWRIVSHFGPHSSEQFREIVFEFNKVSTGVKRLEDRDENCYNLVYNRLPMALSRLFVDNFFTEKEKKEASELIDSIQQSFHRLIQQNQWLDEETKSASSSKLEHVIKNVAYPTWLKNNDQLDEYYFLQNKTEALALLANKNFLISLTEFSALQIKQNLEDLVKPVNVDKKYDD